jgi:HK97 gp10 family phage protein
MDGLTFSGSGGFRGDRSNTVRIEGDEEIIARLFALTGTIGRRYLGKAVKESMRPMKAALLANTPHGPTGNAREAVADKVKIYATGTVFGIVGYRRAVSKKDQRGNKGFHSHLLEFGTDERRPKNGRLLSTRSLGGWRPPGWIGPSEAMFRRARPMRAQRPMLRAYQSSGAQCAGIMESEMASALDRAINELGGAA